MNIITPLDAYGHAYLRKKSIVQNGKHDLKIATGPGVLTVVKPIDNVIS